MTTMTLAVQSELKNKMEEFPEMNWSEVARQAFMQRIKDLEFLRKFKSDSTLTDKDALRLGRKVNKALSNRLRNLRK